MRKCREKRWLALVLSLVLMGTALFSNVTMIASASEVEDDGAADAPAVVPEAPEAVSGNTPAEDETVPFVLSSEDQGENVAEVSNTEDNWDAGDTPDPAGDFQNPAGNANDPADTGDITVGDDSGEPADTGREFYFEDENVRVTASAESSDILPEDTQIRVEKVTTTDNLDNAYKLLSRRAEEKGTGLIDFAVYDVTFYSGGTEVEPSGPVSVRIEFIGRETLACASNDTTDVEIAHITDSNELETVEAQAVINSDDSLAKIELTNDSFSEYPVAVYGNKVEGESFEVNAIDSQIATQAAALFDSRDTTDESGLSLNKTARLNEDGTATITLEAYATGKISTSYNKLPTDIVLVLDQSGSMAQTITNYIYTPVYNIPESGYYINETYYIEDAGKYKKVQYGRHRHGYNDYNWHYGWYYEAGGYQNVDVYPFTSESGRKDGSTPAYQFYSMSEDSKSKMDALKTAVGKFIENVKTDAQDRAVDNRIAVVGYGVGEQIDNYTWWYPKSLNTELFIGSKGYSYYNDVSFNNYQNDFGWVGAQYKGINGQYKNAFQSVASAAGYNNLIASKNALAPSGSTRADLGMDMAINIFNAYPDSDYMDAEGSKIRNKVVIMFTDGEPNNGSGFGDTYASAAIAKSKVLKDSGVTVYAAGVVDGLNPDEAPRGNSSRDDNSVKMNRYMHYLSSNYPNATDLNNPGRDGDYKAGYFLSAADAASLDEIFENISGSIGSSSTTIGKEAVLTDYIADSFDLSKIDQGRDITVYTSDYRGGGNWSDKTRFDDVEVEVDQDNKTVSVTNFDYSGNFILDEDPETGAPKGQKIIVEITVPTIDGFVGGNQVPTNTSDAAIYEHDEVFKAFPEPDVDVLSNTILYRTMQVFI